MDLNLAKCARCDKLFNRIVSAVCESCQPDEDQDFNRIHEVISMKRGLTAEQVAVEAEVPVECVLRMMSEGRIDKVESEDAKCGRCGAPAISVTKRLCQNCLVDLDRECAHAMMEMRQRIRRKEESDMHDVHGAVSNKRTPQKGRGTVATPSPPSQSPPPAQRMAVRKKLNRKK